MTTDEYIYCLLAWPLLGLLLFAPIKARKSIGLDTAIIALFALNHWFGALVCFLPWYTGNNYESTALGFLESTLGIIALSFGIFASRWVLSNSRSLSHRSVDNKLIRQTEHVFLKIGLGFYFLLFIGLGRIASLTSLLSTGTFLVLASICLKIKRSLDTKMETAAIRYLSYSLLLPGLTLLTQGFLGFGTTYFLIVFFFFSSQYSNRKSLVVATAIMTFLGMSAFVTYMRDRFEIRETVWGGQALEMRVNRIIDTMLSPEVIDFTNQKHIERIDSRLNQNWLIGTAVTYLQGPGKFAQGDTLWLALVALIPRVVWPDKPIIAGSMGIVSEYTGLIFSEGTSVGMGYIFEFYINFGRWGVLCGMFVVGAVIGFANKRASEYLNAQDFSLFARWFLIGISLLNVAGSMVEISVSVAASIVITEIMRRLEMSHNLQDKTNNSSKPSPKPSLGT